MQAPYQSNSTGVGNSSPKMRREPVPNQSKNYGNFDSNKPVFASHAQILHEQRLAVIPLRPGAENDFEYSKDAWGPEKLKRIGRAFRAIPNKAQARKKKRRGETGSP
jgi:hypothetical protein